MFSNTATTLIGHHPKHIKAIELAKNIAITKAPALILGEAGTGKKRMCEFIHQSSVRAEGPFMVVDCAKDTAKVEGEVLGYRDEETGKFNKGVLETGNGGTVVLANIDAIDERFQKRLYQILTELPDYELDVRVLATSSKNLSKYVSSGRFQRALFTYFSSTQITLLPLRDRGNDIALLAEVFANEISISKNMGNVVLAEDAKNKLNTFYWTHNITELKNVISNSLDNAKNGVLDVNAIEIGEKKTEVINMDNDESGFRLMSLKDAERLLIKKALIHTSENRTQAAKILGVSIRTLRNKINEYRGEGNNYFVNLR
ncbi:sigma 54-interacting transcriptional regulator [Bacteriovoracaceae bacterium]|nr:sigma 54-interacting transcriptional regulator [Bacteriovoracaceae bacterium]